MEGGLRTATVTTAEKCDRNDCIPGREMRGHYGATHLAGGPAVNPKALSKAATHMTMLSNYSTTPNPSPSRAGERVSKHYGVFFPDLEIRNLEVIGKTLYNSSSLRIS